jgi:selT/selW/selH-like putative selenoprotein
VAGGGGIFDVDVDGERVWSKHVEGDFPDDEALIERLRG